MTSIAPGSILRDTAPHPVDGIDGRYFVDLPEAWRVMYEFGGVTMALALRCGVDALARPELRLVTADATFCQAIPVGQVAVQVEILRSGRSGAQVQARLWSTDDPHSEPRSDLVVTAVLAKNRLEMPRLVGCELPADLRSPEECSPRDEPSSDSPLGRIPFHQQTDWRLAYGPPLTAASIEPTEPRVASWFRFNESSKVDGAWRPETLAVPGDILGPALIAGTGRSPDQWFFIVTLQLSMQWFGPLHSDWVLQHSRAHQAGDGFATGVAELWSEDRELVALATQCAYLQPISPATVVPESAERTN